MSFQRLLEPDIKRFIREHENSDIRKLALKKSPNKNWPYPLILDQIKARQKAKVKILQWLEHHDDIIFPPSDILEQASSNATAHYKASLFEGKNFIDLTGGAGIDFWAISKNFKRSTCVDQNPNAINLIAHNMTLFQRKNIDTIESKAENYLKETDNTDLIYIDPQRRDNNKKGMFHLSDCSPNIIDLLPLLKEKAKMVMIKTSPMLDIKKAIQELEYVHATHIIEWRGDCKEVLYVLNFDKKILPENIPHICAALNDDGETLHKFKFTRAEEQSETKTSAPLKYLYEPGPAFQKAGGFNALGKQLNLKKLHKHTQLYTSETLNTDFPGRAFEIQNILPVNRKALSFSKANLTIRNFPGDVSALRKKLKLKEGGDEYLFACTLHDESKALLQCRKA